MLRGNGIAPHTPRRPGFSRRERIAASLSIGIIGSLFLLLLAFSAIESYFPFDPDIDTRFAPGYSEEAFTSLQVGMSKEEVLQRLGPPLSGQASRTWYYSTDGACPWWDFAWLARNVEFDEEGRIAALITGIRRD